VNLLVTNFPSFIGSNAVTLGLKNLLFPDIGVSNGPPDKTRIEHHRKDELFVQQNTIPHGQTTSLCHLLSRLIDMR